MASTPDTPSGQTDATPTMRRRAVAVGAAIVAFVVLAGITWLVPRNTGDTFMMLAGGRDIVDGRLGEPDAWAYSNPGRVWVNQNWGVCLIFHLLYESFGGMGLVIIKAVLIAVAGLTVACVGRARGASWPAVLITAGVTLLVCRHYIDMRANLFALALLPTMMAALYFARTGRHRVWAAVALLVVWANLHGSFVFGIGMLGLWSLCHLVPLLFKANRVAALREHWSWLAAPPAAIVLCAVATPWGLTNLTFPFTSMAGEGSELWHAVAEWEPILTSKKIAFGSTTEFFFYLALIPFGFAARWAVERASNTPASDDDKPAEPTWWPTTVCHVLIVLLTVYMAFGARRFIPYPLLLATPFAAEVIDWALRRRTTAWATVGIAMVTALLGLFVRWDERATYFQQSLTDGQWWPIALGAIVVAVPIALFAVRWRKPHAPGWPVIAIAVISVAAGVSLLPRVLMQYDADNPGHRHPTMLGRMVKFDFFPWQLSRFVNANDLRGRVFNHWHWEGFLRWRCGDRLQMFMGGRAQTAYDVKTYSQFLAMYRLANSGDPQQTSAELSQQLIRLGARFVIIPSEAGVFVPKLAFFSASRWVPIYCDGDAWMFVALNDETRDLVTRAATGQLEYPDERIASLSRAMCLGATLVNSRPDAYLNAVREAGRALPTAQLYQVASLVAQREKISDEKMIAFLEAEAERLAPAPLQIDRGIHAMDAHRAVCILLAKKTWAAGDPARGNYWATRANQIERAKRQWFVDFQAPRLAFEPPPR